MSISVMTRVWKESPAKGSELLILLALADFADDDGVSWPSVETLAQKARLSKRQTQYNIQSLVNAGLLIVETNAGPHGVHRYRIAGCKVSTRANPAPVQKASKRGAKSARGGAKNVTEGVQPIAPKPSIEPSLEPSEEPSGMPRNGDAQTLLAVLYEDVLQIGKPTDYKQAVGQAQLLVKAGSNPDEVRAIAEWLMADPFWAQKGITIGLVLKKRDEWRSAQKTPKNITPFQANTHRRPPGQRGYSADELLAMAREEANR